MHGAGSGIRAGALTVAGVLAGTVPAGCGDDSGSAGRAEGASAESGAGAGSREQGTRAVRSACAGTSEQGTARGTLRVRTTAEGTPVTADGHGTAGLAGRAVERGGGRS
ncbi:hypothetical protein [Streptomyces sp. NPDC052701]|uniref:hypothetical protein n=1 Tax=Streptomyces sp. NPDC052701 TaxID=3155533 RepID=UPI003437F991